MIVEFTQNCHLEFRMFFAFFYLSLPLKEKKRESLTRKGIYAILVANELMFICSLRGQHAVSVF
jgi:hypothetical protein